MAGHVAGVLLAAGQSRRLGQPKQLLKAGGETLVARAARCLLDAGCSPVYVVVGSGGDLVRVALAGMAVEVVDNPRWQDGLGASIAAGVGAAGQRPQTDAIVLCACDQPMIGAGDIRALVEAFQHGTSQIAAAGYSGTVGIPALFGRQYFDRLQALPASAGAKDILRHAEGLMIVPMPRGAFDLDTPEDLAEYLRNPQKPPD